ncbi:MAG: hypothetical protein F6K62_09395 [Sphaerospermopsis sp. SIO1G2]|nr:hypothetical protein [Sphaerospermopsis sp. SIO1G2]
MKSNVFNLSPQRLGTIIGLAFISVLSANQSLAQSSIIPALRQKLQREGRIIVYGNPIMDTIYTIRGINFTFAGEGCNFNEMCQSMVANGGLVYEQQANYALGRACADKKNRSVICIVKSR